MISVGFMRNFFLKMLVAVAGVELAEAQNSKGLKEEGSNGLKNAQEDEELGE